MTDGDFLPYTLIVEESVSLTWPTEGRKKDFVVVILSVISGKFTCIGISKNCPSFLAKVHVCMTLMVQAFLMQELFSHVSALRPLGLLYIVDIFKIIVSKYVFFSSLSVSYDIFACVWCWRQNVWQQLWEEL